MLVKMSNKESRIWVFEIMLNSTAIKNNLKKNDISQIDATIEGSTWSGMISMDQYAKKLIDKWVINEKDIEWMLKKDQIP